MKLISLTMRMMRRHPTCIHCDNPKYTSWMSCLDCKTKPISSSHLFKGFKYPKNNDIKKQFKDEHPRKYMPANSLSYAIEDAFKALDSCKSSHKKFELHRKKFGNILWIEPECLSKTLAYCFKIDYNIRLHPKIRKNKPIVHTQERYTKIIKQGNRYYLMLTEYCKPKTLSNQGTVALDPGVRTPISMYSTNEIKMFGENCANKLRKINGRIDRTPSIFLKKFLYQKKINLVNGLHLNIANYLVKNYSDILYSTLHRC
jgi:hypothetical protein